MKRCETLGFVRKGEAQELIDRRPVTNVLAFCGEACYTRYMRTHTGVIPTRHVAHGKLEAAN